MTLPRRHLLRAAALAPGLGLLPGAWALPPRVLQFPRDHGAHPELRTEWWYLTGHAQTANGRGFGFQVTFFRSRVDSTQVLQSRLAARQLLVAHAAITDLQGGKLWHDERTARWNGQPGGSNDASLADTALRLQDWSMARDDLGYHMAVRGDSVHLALNARPTQPLLPQGAAGLSRKGPEPAQASYYYSQPQLQVSGTLGLPGQRFEVLGRAWLDHEWSEALLHPEAVGWDWLGMNLADGSALTAFRLRRADGSALWAGGSLRGPADASARVFAPDDVRFEPQRHWTSPQTGARYPVEWRLQSPAGRHTVRALLDAQELDARGSTGNVYWEGVSDLLDAGGAAVGRGYLEMTGYTQRLRL
ncbi:lipocalin-like domain-containing protein [Hydrogenophaga sp. OTU3427]|uniref:lipocalin-like domain-containing protein n=1 Tax=Hydrogenophaga sp. OTU3427 TaxID=3043856 RepID=UPI00313C06F3